MMVKCVLSKIACDYSLNRIQLLSAISHIILSLQASLDQTAAESNSDIRIVIVYAPT